jgi:hypothetical protein
MQSLIRLWEWLKTLLLMLNKEYLKQLKNTSVSNQLLSKPNKQLEDSESISFKTDREKGEWEILKIKNKLLVKITEYLSKLSKEKANKEIIITSIFRTLEEQKKIYGVNVFSVHVLWRALDVRSFIYTEEQIKYFVEEINKKFMYDPTRTYLKVCLYHSVNHNGWHLHLQTCDKTVEV